MADVTTSGGTGTLTASTLTKFLDPLPIPPVRRPRPGDEPVPQMTVRMRDAWVRLHSQLPQTRVWAYDGYFPGPTIEVPRGRGVRIAWANEITGPFPVLAVEKQGATPGPGRDGAEPLADVAALPAWTVVHAHGAKTNAWNDGLSDNAVLPGSTQLSEYPNDQPSATLWYHDHAMGITALNVMTGLAGMYLIRDDEERALRLPDEADEIPLIICDRNLDTDDGTPNGNLTGRLLHKVNIFRIVPVTNQKVTVHFTGPFNLVNGRIWPHLDVKGRWYRFRLLNASNGRTYTLELRDEAGASQTGILHLIGTDSGLLPKPVTLDQLTLAPAERADVLIDFSAFKGKSLTLVNVAAPLQTVPEVMQFRVGKQNVHNRFNLPDTLSPSFALLTHDNLPPHNHRWLVLTPPNPNTSSNPNPPVPGHPEMWEMQEVEAASVTPPSDGIVQVQDGMGTVRTLQRVARDMQDATNYFVEYDGWEQWNILNISGSPLITHPIHIHLIRFQLLSRDTYDTSTFDIEAGGTTSPISYTGTLPDDPSEKGWKDTIRVPPGQMVHVAGQFAGGTGRFMYHCHMLEHEDHGMMRPFVVIPAQVMKVDPHMGGGSHEHTTAHRVTPGPALGGPVTHPEPRSPGDRRGDRRPDGTRGAG